jgi:FkbM family methyltransferase
MTATVTTNPGRRAVKWLVNLIRSIPFVRQLAYKLIRQRDIQIASGAGAGLKFNIAGLNPSYASGTNEMPIQEALVSRIKAGDVFLDIGANIGFFSVIGARLVGPDGRVYAFEPVPANLTALQRNIGLNQFANTKIMQSAVSNHSGKGELLLADWGGGSALKGASTPPDICGTMEVELVTIDQLVEQGEIEPPAVVKIDVEGAELEVLQGMARTLEKHHPVLIYELDDDNPERYQQKQDACEAYLLPLGYHITRLDDSYPGTGWIVGHYLAVAAG